MSDKINNMNSTNLSNKLQNATRRLSTNNRKKIFTINRMKLLKQEQSKEQEKSKDNTRKLSILVENFEKCQNKEVNKNLFYQMNILMKNQKNLSKNLVEKIVKVIEQVVINNEPYLCEILDILEQISKNYEELIHLFFNSNTISLLYQHIQKQPQKNQLLFQFSFILRYLISKHSSLQKKYRQYEYFNYVQPLYYYYKQILSQQDKWEQVSAYYKIIRNTDIQKVIFYQKEKYQDTNGSIEMKNQFNKIYQEIIDEIEISIICINEIAFELYEKFNFQEISFSNDFAMTFCELYFYYKKNIDTKLSFLEFLCDFSSINENFEIIDQILIQGQMLNELLDIVFDELTQSFFKKSALITLYNFTLIAPKYTQIWTENIQKLEDLIQLYFDSNLTTYQIDILSLICQISYNANSQQWIKLCQINFDQVLISFFDQFYCKPNSSQMICILDSLESLLKLNAQYEGNLHIKLSEGSFIEHLADLQEHVKEKQTFNKIQHILTEYFYEFIQ